MSIPDPTGIPRRFSRQTASTSAWLKPLARFLDGWTGTGTRTSACMRRICFSYLAARAAP